MSYGFNNDKSRFPLGVASDLPDPTKTPMKIIGELQNQIIDSASIENGATASKAYASGDYVCFQGALCKASKAISQGDTLSIGDSANDNLTLTDAAAEFARINSDLTDTLYYGTQTFDYTVYTNLYHNARITRHGNTCMLEVHGFNTLATNYENNILGVGVIIPAFRPREDVVFTVFDPTGTCYRITATSSGALNVYMYSGGSGAQNNVLDYLCYVI